MKIYCVKCADDILKNYVFKASRKRVQFVSNAKRMACIGCGFEIVIKEKEQ